MLFPGGKLSHTLSFQYHFVTIVTHLTGSRIFHDYNKVSHIRQA